MALVNMLVWAFDNVMSEDVQPLKSWVKISCCIYNIQISKLQWEIISPLQVERDLSGGQESSFYVVLTTAWESPSKYVGT